MRKDKSAGELRRRKTGKLEPLVKIRRRLKLLWKTRVLAQSDLCCVVCGKRRGELLKSGKKIVLHTHHLEGSQMCRALRYDALNGVALCVKHHKYGQNSAHKGGIWFAAWLRKHRYEQYLYVLANRKRSPPDLDDRVALYEIEERLTGPMTDEDKVVLEQT
jgi:hypothetical protein